MPSSTTSTALLRAAGAGHQFQPNWWCLRDVTVELRPGQVLGIVGPNGAGKSTLLRILAGQLVPTAGSVTLDGTELRRMPRRALARRIAWLPQTIPAAFDFTVEQIVAHGRYPHSRTFGALDAHDRAVIRAVMESTHTLAFAHRSVLELSGGERQRVFLASVLAQEAGLLLLDEPTSALDLQFQADIFARLAELARNGLGVAVVTHDLNLAAQYCTHMLLLHEGRRLAEGSPAEVIRADLLRRAYGANVIVERNPVTGTPLVVVLPRRPGELAGAGAC